MKMFFAYVLKSVHHTYYYKGHCQDLQKRLKEHNQGMTRSIRPYIPFEIVYYEVFETVKQAIERERYFKSAVGRRFFEKDTGAICLKMF